MPKTRKRKNMSNNSNTKIVLESDSTLNKKEQNKTQKRLQTRSQSKSQSTIDNTTNTNTNNTANINTNVTNKTNKKRSHNNQQTTYDESELISKSDYEPKSKRRKYHNMPDTINDTDTSTNTYNSDNSDSINDSDDIDITNSQDDSCDFNHIDDNDYDYDRNTDKRLREIRTKYMENKVNMHKIIRSGINSEDSVWFYKNIGRLQYLDGID